jgi:hypothetical protein
MASEENARSRASERERMRFPRFTDIYGYMIPPSDHVFPITPKLSGIKPLTALLP